MSTSLRRTGFILSCAALLIGAALWFAAHALGASGARSHRSDSARVSAALVRDFSALRGAPAHATSAPVISPTLATDFQIMAIGPRAPLGIMTSDATYVPLSGTTNLDGLWLLPGSGGMCMLAMMGSGPHPGAGSCASTAEASAGRLMGIWESLSPSGVVQETTIAGVAPDGVTSATAVGTDGSTATSPVTDNAYVVHETGLASVKLTTASGSTMTVDVRTARGRHL
jgi:hypothetical protein